MKLLKEMIENIINENDESAQVHFHGYLTEKMKRLTESEGPINFELDIDDSEISLDELKKEAFLAGASRFKKVGDIMGTKQVQITVPNRRVGHAVLNALYGPEDYTRDSNDFFLGLED